MSDLGINLRYSLQRASDLPIWFLIFYIDFHEASIDASGLEWACRSTILAGMNLSRSILACDFEGTIQRRGSWPSKGGDGGIWRATQTIRVNSLKPPGCELSALLGEPGPIQVFGRSCHLKCISGLVDRCIWRSRRRVLPLA